MSKAGPDDIGNIPANVGGAIPPFRLESTKFEELCRDLLEKETDISYALLHETSGNQDFGVDVIGYTDNGETVVIQCKAEKKFYPSDIRSASEEFLEHWDTKWSKQDVKKFILAVTCDVKSTKSLEQVREETKRFNKLGLKYEPWFHPRLLQKLEPHRRLVSRYLDQGLVERLCGTVAEIPLSNKVQLRALSDSLDEAKERLGSAEGSRLEQLKRAWRSGQVVRVQRELAEILGCLDTELLGSKLAQAYLRFGLQVFCNKQPARARSILDSLRKFYPDVNHDTPESMLLASEGNFKDALELLEPHDSDTARELKGAILLNQDQPSAAIREISSIPKPSVNASTTLALAHLLERDFESAEQALSTAQTEEPFNEQVKLAQVKLLFYRALSPAACPSRLGEFLSPVDPALVKFDSEQPRLVKQLRTLSETVITSTEDNETKRELRRWLFASLCLFEEVQSVKSSEEALDEEWQRELPDYVILTWGLTYLGLMHQEAAEERLVSLLEERPEYIVPLLVFYLQKGQRQVARQLIDERLTTTADPNEEELLLSWRNNCETAEESVDDRDPSTLYADYHKSGSPAKLRRAMLMRNNARDWEWLAEHGDELTTQLQTAEALVIVSAAAYNTKEFNRCIELSDRHQAPPRELLLHKFYSLLELGKSNAAEEFFDQISSRLEKLEYLRCQVALAQERANPDVLPEVGRSLLEEPQASTQDLLQVAYLVCPVDEPLAETLLRRAFDVGIPDALVAMAFVLINQLGLDTQPIGISIFRRLHDAAKRSSTPMKLVNREEVLALMSEGAAQLEELVSLVQRAQVPNHLFAESVRCPMSRLYLLLPSLCRKTQRYLDLPALYIRSGRREREPDLSNLQLARLHLDISALLTLNQLGLLGELGGWFETIRIPSSVKKAIGADLELLVKRSSQETSFLKAVQKALEKGLLGVSFVEETCVREILEGLYTLRATGKISENSYGKVVKRLGLSAPDSVDKTREPKSAMNVSLEHLRGLHGDNAFEPFLKYFSVSVPDRVRIYVEKQLEESAQRRKLRDKVERLRRNIEARLSTPDWEEFDVVLSQEDNPGPYTRVVFDLMKFQASDNDVICIDDRLLSRHTFREPQVPLQTSYELLTYLHETERIDDSRYYTLLLELRSRNYRFLPLEAEEVTHWLLQAPIQDRDLQTTEALSIISASVAAALYDSPHLEKPIGDERGEWPFLIQLNRAMSMALARCFKLEPDDAKAQARAYWILESLFVDLTGLRLCAGAESKGRLITEAGSALGMMVATVFIEMSAPDAASQLARKRYLEWLYSVFLYRLETSPELRKEAAQSYKAILLGRENFDDLPGEDNLKLYRQLQMLHYSDLPEVLRRELLDDATFVETIGLPTRSEVSFANLSFETSAFVEALDQAVESGSANLRDLEDKPVNVDYGSSSWQIATEDKRIAISPVLSAAYHYDSKDDERSVNFLYPGFDGPLDLIENKMKGLDEPRERLLLALDWLSDSPEQKYERLGNNLLQDSSHKLELLIPADTDRLLLRYHLIRNEYEIGTVLTFERAAESLSKVSLELAFERLSVFPIPLPDSLISRFTALPTTEQTALVELLRKRSSTPLRKLHLCRLCLATNLPEAKQSALGLLREFISEAGRQQLEAFLSILAWSQEHFCKPEDDESPSWQARLILAWAHAEELFRQFTRARISPPHLSEQFAKFRRPLAGLSLQLRALSRITRDACFLSPKNSRNFFVAGLIYACGGFAPALASVQEAILGEVYQDQEGQVFHPLFLMDLWKTDALGSWLAREQYETGLAEVLGPEKSPLASRQGLETEIKGLLDRFSADPLHNHQLIPLLALLIKQGDCPNWVTTSIEPKMIDVGLSNLVSHFSETFDETTIVVTAATLASNFSENGRSRFFAQLVDVLKRSSASWEWAQAGFEALIELERVSSTTSERTALLSEHTIKLLKAVPSFSSRFKVSLGGLLLEIGNENAYPLWRAVTFARARCGPETE